MDKKQLIIIGVIIIVIAAYAIFMFNPSSEEIKTTEISILNNNTLGENSTLYVKLIDKSDESLSNKTIHITVLDDNNTCVFNTSSKTHFTGVAIVKLDNLSNGDYKVNVTFDGDENYTGSSSVKKITIGEKYVAENFTNITNITENITLDTTDTQDTQNTESAKDSSSQKSSSSSDSSKKKSSSSSSKSKSDSNELTYYDENGKVIKPTIDENGKKVYD